MSIKPRVPEGGAIEDTDEMSMEKYSEIMKKRLGREYIKFAGNVITKVDPPKNSKVLEIGPGPGWAGIELLKKRKDLFLDGLEASKDMVRVASRNAADENLSDQTNYFKGFGEDMNTLPDDEYDLVISRDSMHHWDDPEKVFHAILFDPLTSSVLSMQEIKDMVQEMLDKNAEYLSYFKSLKI